MALCLLTVLFVCGLLPTGGCSKNGSSGKGVFYTGLEAGFKFDRKLKNCGSVRLRTTNAYTTFVRDGVFGKACRFAGNSTFMMDDLRFEDSGTWALWFRVAPDADLQEEIRIIDANHYRFSLVKEKLEMRFHDGSWRKHTVLDKVVPGQWTHAAVTWAGDRVRFYVNGTLVRTMSYRGTPAQRVRSAVAGARWTGDGNWFKGDIDELLMYSRALAAEEIKALQTDGLDNATPPEFIAATEDVIMEFSGVPAGTPADPATRSPHEETP